MALHVGERKALAGERPAGVFAGGAEEGIAFGFERRQGDAFGIALHLVERRSAVEFVLGDEVDLILAPAVPPAAKSGVASGLGELGMEVTLARE